MEFGMSRVSGNAIPVWYQNSNDTRSNECSYDPKYDEVLSTWVLAKADVVWMCRVASTFTLWAGWGTRAIRDEKWAMQWQSHWVNGTVLFIHSHCCRIPPHIDLCVCAHWALVRECTLSLSLLFNTAGTELCADNPLPLCILIGWGTNTLSWICIGS